VFVILLTVTTAIGVLMALTGHQRAWCKVCPAGTMAYWLGRGKGQQLNTRAQDCKHCDACARVCPMGLQPAGMAAADGPTDADCLKCSSCVYRCPVQVLSLDPRKTHNDSFDQREAAA